MSLESKIEILITSINALNVNIAKLVNVPICDNPDLAAEILDREMPKAVTEPVLTHKGLQDSIMVMVREDMKRKPKIKGLLAMYSASKVSDLEADKLEAFKAELVKL